MSKSAFFYSNSFLLFLLCMILSPCALADSLAAAINNGNGGTFSLDGSKTYTCTGGVYIQADTNLNGNGALIDLGSEDLVIQQGSHLNIKTATIRGGRLLVLGNSARYWRK